MFPAYVGYDGGIQGWMVEMVANGASRMRTYGRWIAERYNSRGNIMWMLGGDYARFNSTEAVAEQALIDGLKSVGVQASKFYSAEWDSGMIGTDPAAFGDEVNLNGVYTWSGETASHGRRAYAHSPTMPAFLLEEPYDEEGPEAMNYNSNAIPPVRRFVYWGLLSTIGGYVAGNGYVWRFNDGWETHLDTPGAFDLKRLNDLWQSIPWWRLVPEGLGGMGMLVTAGNGIIDHDYVAAAATVEGDLLLAYVSPDHAGTMTIDMTKLRGLVRARWFDPTSGRYTAIGMYPNLGERAFTTPGTNSAGARDWVLQLDLQ
jgi:hypothetical protein